MMLHLQSLKYFSIGMPLKSVDKKSTLDSFIFSKKIYVKKQKENPASNHEETMMNN